MEKKAVKLQLKRKKKVKRQWRMTFTNENTNCLQANQENINLTSNQKFHENNYHIVSEMSLNETD